MQRYSIIIENVKAEARPAANPDGTLYLAADVDARIAELEKALRDVVEQADDYFHGDSGFPFKDAVDRAKSVL